MIQRSEVEEKDTWDLNSLYPSLEAWSDDYSKVTPKVPGFKDFKGSIEKSAEQLAKVLEVYFSLSRSIEKLYTYAHLRHDEEITDTKNKESSEKALILLQEFGEVTSWLEPEILALPNAVLQGYLNDAHLSPYKFHLEKLIRLKEHTLSDTEEELLALSSRALQTAHKAFSSINNADLKFSQVMNSKGEPQELTIGRYQLYMQSRDRVLRENAFKGLHNRYQDYENTLCDLIQGQVLTHQFNAKVRKFSSCLEAAIKPKNIDVTVYKSLIKAVRDEIGALHDYLALRKKILKVPELHLYDLSVPLTQELDITIDYKKAEELVIESVRPLGQEYQELLKKGLLVDRWVDRFENTNKRTGAYSSGCFDSHPYVLMNFKGVVRDLFTLAHECGHSMHSLYSRKNQPYQYSDYPIFVAEVASTFNEELLSQLLLKQTQSKEEKIFYINSKIEDIRATLFRQTLFAEFELMIHEFVEKNVPLTPALLKQEYRKLVQFYFGEHVCIDDEIDIEWARIPHFYYNFYVYQYATGISAALALADKVTKGSDADREAYLTFLKGGSSKYPIDLLKTAGVDMRTDAPVKAAIQRFRSLVKELETLYTSEL